MRTLNFLLTLFFLLSSSYHDNTPSFDYKQAIQMLKQEIKASTNFYPKRLILEQTDRIINEDSLFYRIHSNHFDIEYEERKIINNALNAKDFREYSVEDSIEAYRLEIDRSFYDEIIFITAENRKGVKKLIVLSYSIDDECNYMVGSKKFDISCFHLLRNKEKLLDDSQWDTLLQLVEENEYWDLQEIIEAQQIDGSYWSLHGTKVGTSLKDDSKEQKVHFLFRQTPRNHQAIHIIGSKLLEWSGVDWGEIF